MLLIPYDAWLLTRLLLQAEGHSDGSSAGMSQQLDFLMSSMRSKIQNAVSEMQAQLQEELQEEELKIYHVLGQGAFGTVYHGARLSFCECESHRTVSRPPFTHAVCCTSTLEW